MFTSKRSRRAKKPGGKLSRYGAFGRTGVGIGLCAGAAAIAACSAQDAMDQNPQVPMKTGTAQQPLVPSPGARDFIAFESGPVRPMAMSSNGAKLFVTNIPDNHLEIYNIDASGNLTPSGSVRVGLEPVAVAARNDGEVWVVNHLSDSVSIVDVAANPPRVKRTLLVGDEPRDIVFSANGRAFITTAHRGQNRSLVAAAKFTTGTNDPQLQVESVPRADVWVFDPANLGTLLGGDPLKVVELFGDTPRALAVSGNTVYAAVLNSGNQTTLADEGVICETNQPCVIKGVEYPGGDWGPATNHAGAPHPRVGLVLKYDNATSTWKDLTGRNWNAAVRFNLPDKDVFAIDAAALTETASYAHVGTTLFNMAVNPASGKLYVSNTDSQNHNRFEGPGTYVPGQTVMGNLAHSQITVISAGAVTPRHLNKHINYSVRPAPAGTKAYSLATPVEMAVTSDGSSLWVAAFGSDKVAKYSTADLEANTFNPTTQGSAAQFHHEVSGGGPGGLVLNQAKNRLYVYTRFDNGISVINTTLTPSTNPLTHVIPASQEVAHIKLHNPEPDKVKDGRRFLYDAYNTSSNGEASCASCHIFGDKDELGWDLGNPDGNVQTTQYEIHLDDVQTLGSVLGALEPDLGQLFEDTQVNGTGNIDDLHPMKGPMTTQTFRGMQNSGAMHWRGDRSKGFFGDDTRQEPPYDSRLSFKNFIVAFEGLVGNAENGVPAMIDVNDMDKFADFALELFMPPNPIRALDNSLTSAQYRGMRFYMGCDGTDSLTWWPASCDSNNKPIGKGHFSDGAYIFGIGERCEGCHVLDPAKGFFGTDGDMSFTALPQITKVPQIRNAYTKVGMFGRPSILAQNEGNNDHKGDQIRGSGFASTGGVDSLLRFFNGRVFNKRGPNNAVGFAGGDAQRADIVEWVFAFPTDLAPVTGQQITLTSTNSGVAGPRIDLLKARANQNFTSNLLGTGVKECELTASGVVGGVAKSWLWRPTSSNFEPDDGTANISDETLRGYAATAGQEITFTCVPPGSGVRTALDRDRDGFANRVDACPADSGCTVQCQTGYLDCDQVPPCTEYYTTNTNHMNASPARVYREWKLLYYQYYTVGGDDPVGTSGSTNTRLHTYDHVTFHENGCPAPAPVCETNGASDLNNCGACGAVCSFAHAGETCSNGECSMGTCETGWTDCNGAAADGCEANFTNDVNNCGGCGLTCSFPNAADTCSSGSCVMGTCETGFANCNNQQADGCEIDLTADPSHCGNCATVCNFPNAGTDCVNSTCTMGDCDDGFANCNSQQADGCEADLDSSTAHCGACNNACTFANATAACNVGTCELSACNSGWANCDGNMANGCETQGSCTITTFQYTPSNFSPTDPNLSPGSTPGTTNFNCGTSQFNSETLAFTNWCGQTTPNPVVRSQTNGPDVIILPVRSMNVLAGNTLKITGNRPVIIAAYGDATISGTLDGSAVANANGPGGNVLCSGSTGGNGTGNTGSDDGDSGGGGGGFAIAGAQGGTGQSVPVGAAGAVIGNASLVPLRGGCAGGKGGNGSGGDAQNYGGGGGGGVQLSAAGTLTVNGVVTSVGGGGRRGIYAENGGGGGGSGGGLLLEGLSVSMASGSWLTANGGSGASGAHEDQANAVNGNDGNKNSTAQALGGVSPADGGPGGKGAASGGTTGMAGGAGNTNDDGGGGGGGAHGRIRVNGISACTVSSTVSGSLSKNACCDTGACTTTAPDTSCTSAAYGGKNYWFCTNARTFEQARNNCMAVGYNLASIESSGENTFIDTNLGTANGWIGINDRDEYSDEGYFVWQNGRAVSYTAWNAGEPNNWNGIEDCAEQYNGGAWNDVDCAATRPYVCEFAGTDHSTSVGENGTANLTCASGVIREWTAMYGDPGGTCPVSCMSCTLGASSCSVTFNNTNCGDCNVGTVKPGYLKLTCE